MSGKVWASIFRDQKAKRGIFKDTKKEKKGKKIKSQKNKVISD